MPLVRSIDSVSCKNYGLTADLVEKYPYCDLAGLRYCDSDLKCIARESDRSPEGLCLIRTAPLYLKGPKIATLVTQYGLGKPYEENRLAQKIVRNCGQESFVRHLRQDTSDNRLVHFNKALQSLSGILKNNVHPDINKVILPIGIGRSLVDKQWMCRYEIIKKFAREIPYSGVESYITVRKPYRYAIDKFVNKRCSARAKSQFKELKSLSWKDVDEKLFNELINKADENLLQNIYKSNSVSSNNHTSTEVDSNSNDHDDDDILKDAIIFDDTLHPYFNQDNISL